MAKEITSQQEDYSQWYLDIVKKADLASNSKVRGCMVIKPYGFAIWEKMRDDLDRRFKETGHQNAYFPLFIPKSFLSREAAHVEGFAKECAVVTHHRLMNDPNGNGVIVDPDAKLEEELIVRPTSETIIWDTYRDWISSYRDLPLLINQWANVVRWEMRTRFFLRTTEFLWQEGHTAHATKEEAVAESLQMLDVYSDFAREIMAMPVIKGEKTEQERFAGAENTYTIEALMQDGKALQAGTSHFLGQNFAKAFEVKFLNRNNQEEYVWATSWGVSTRLMGALIMTHSDDDGLVLPPRLAPIQVVIVPFPAKQGAEIIEAAVASIMSGLKSKGISVKYDNDEKTRPGFKFAEHEMRGVPIRLGVGLKDLEKGVVEVARRDTKEKNTVELLGIADYIEKLLEEIQENLYQRALSRLNNNIHVANNWEEFTAAVENGGFVYAYWDGTSETELKIKELTGATTRCIPFEAPTQEKGSCKCVLTGVETQQRVLFAKAY
jgi:prolyl-tRNA synthetase